MRLLILIMYADDTIILANSAARLKCAMTALQEYFGEWKLQINGCKTKVINFRNSIIVGRHYIVLLFNEDIEVVDPINT